MSRLAAAALATALTLTLTPAAHAHTVYLRHGADVAYVSGRHRLVAVNDNECDGRRVTATVWLLPRLRTAYVHAHGCRAGFMRHRFRNRVHTVWLCEAGICGRGKRA